MAFEPDIVVTGPEGSEIALVVEVKMNFRRLEDSERQLKLFMTAMGAPVGALVTPDRLWLYRDEYLSWREDSITKVGEFDVRNIFHFQPSGASSELEFERFVQSWIERLPKESSLRELPPDLRAAAQMYIVPAVSQGEVRAGHPRSA